MRLFKQSFTIALFIQCLFWSGMTSAAGMAWMDGQPTNFESITGKGKWTAINVWSADCHICRRTAHHMVDIDASMNNVDAYGLSVDEQAGKAKAQQFINQYGLTFPNILSDAGVVDAYIYKHAKETFMGTPTMMLFNPRGKLVAVQPGVVTAAQLENFLARQ